VRGDQAARVFSPSCVSRRVLEFLGQSGLLERVIRPVPGFYIVVDHEASIIDGTVPDIVVALTVANKCAAIGAQ
jgi:hypothetical protein